MTAGVLINDDNGDPVIEIGGHVLSQRPDLLACVGEIASEWAHAEAELERCLAALMSTTAERTFALLKPYRSAKDVSDGAKELAKATLQGQEAEDFSRLIERFKAAAEERNKVQHGLWAKRPNKPSSLYRVRSVDYTRFTISVLQVADPVQHATDFASSLTDEYDLARMKRVVGTIQQLTLDIIKTTHTELQKAELREKSGCLPIPGAGSQR